MASSRSSRDRTKAKDTNAAEKKKKRGGKSGSSSGSSASSKGSRSSSSSSSSSSGSSSRSRSSSSSSSRSAGRKREAGKTKEKKPAATAPPAPTETKKEKPKPDKASKSPSPRRRKRTPTPPPRPTKIHVGQLTRNVTEEHVREIFSVYGTIKNIEYPKDPVHRHLYKGFAYVDFENPDEADKAMKHMDGGQIDGQEISCAPILQQLPKKPRALAGRSPPRRSGGPGRYGRSPPRFAGRRRSPPRGGRGGRSPPPARRPRSRSRSADKKRSEAPWAKRLFIVIIALNSKSLTHPSTSLFDIIICYKRMTIYEIFLSNSKLFPHFQLLDFKNSRLF